MGAQYVQKGNAVDYTPASDLAAGEVVVQGELAGVVQRPIPANTLGSLAVAGVYDFPKATGPGSAIAAGAKVYWDEAEKVAKTDAESGANKCLGKTIVAAGDEAAAVRVRLSQ
jgi:predicted RecA/RadA family phage recombinase